MLVEIAEPWTPAQATERIRSIARADFDLAYKIHAMEQLDERQLIMGDLNFLLQNGFVYSDPEEATRKPYWNIRFNAEPRTHTAERCALS